MAAPSDPPAAGRAERLVAFAPSLPAFALYAAVAAVALLVMPAAVGPACPVRTVTGLKCPGCGALRATHAMAHGHIAEACSYNPALVFTFVALPIGASALFVASRRLSVAAYARTVRATAWTTLLLLAAWTIARNLWTLDAA